MRRAGMLCGPFNDCSKNGGPGTMCECDSQGNCTEWLVGDFNLWHLNGDELQAAFEASTTKFILDKNYTIAEVGLLAEAGLKVGDRLTGILEAGKDGVVRMMQRLEDHEDILTLNFKSDSLAVLYERNGASRAATFANPQISLVPKEEI